MNVQEIAKKARSSISDYCINECHAYCCRKGFLLLTKEELELLTGDKLQELIEKEFVKKQENNLFSLNFSNHLGSCPQLNDSKCMIHKHPKRPSTCEKFPIFVDESKKEIRLSPRCFAVKENKLFPFVHQFIELGFKINKDYF